MVLKEEPKSPESDVTSMSFEETKLTLGLPGEGRSSAGAVKCSAKRGFVETVVDLKVGSSGNCMPGGHDDTTTVIDSGEGKPPPAKEQVVGWPPVRSSRKKAINERFRYVKVAMDGAPFLRKVNLQCYSSYNQLLKDFDNLFDCSNKEESKLMDVVKRMEYVPTYEDKDNDWMLVGDVPWKMFVESCKRIRLMKCSDPTVFTLASKGCSSSSSPKC